MSGAFQGNLTDEAALGLEKTPMTAPIELDKSGFGDLLEALGDDALIDLRSEPPVLTLGDLTLVLDDSQPSKRSAVAVRLFDLLLAVPATIVLSPLMLLIAALVGLTSKGGVIYRSERQTIHGTAFGMLKFRTMQLDADAVLGKHLAANADDRAWFEQHNKLPNDPRVTRVGRKLRALSLDELPQLINVVKGDMSIVGPRPCLHWEAEQFGSSLSTVQRVKGGITGLWQVSGRSDVTFEERILMDVEYAVHRTIWGDVTIILRTVAQVLSGSPGAY